MKNSTSTQIGGSASAPTAGPANPDAETAVSGTGGVDEGLTPEQLAAEWEEESPPAAGALANAASSLVVLAVGAGAVVLSIAMGLGTLAAPEPGLWPFIISCVMVALGLFQLIVGRRNRDAEKFTRMSTAPLAGLVTLAAMVVLMPLIGFELPSMVLCIIWMKFLGGETWRSTLLISTIVVASFYAVFVVALNTSIPHLF